MGRLRVLGPIVTIVLAGALTGFVGSAVVGTVVRAAAPSSQDVESDVARRFMVAYISGDAATVARLQAGDITSQAQAYQQLVSSGGVKNPTSLTFLGGRRFEGITIDLYVAGAMGDNGEQLAPFALTVAGNQVVGIR